MSNSRFATLKATADGSLLRTATLHDKSYIVVPIVSAVGDEVWWPANSANPELVPAEVLESAYWSRNNRPIVAGHPRIDGEFVSANSPDILEKYSYGFTCNSIFEDKRVKVEAWFDKARANEVGPDAVNIISRLENGEQIEVSEGNMVVSEAKEGELDGKSYKSVWISCVNDHLATVSEGACNNKMGCGGPRVNQLKVSSTENSMKNESEGKSNSRFRRIIGALSSTIKAAMSNNELRRKLFKALYESQPGVSYVYDEDVDTKQVIYCVIMSYGDYWDAEYEYHFYRRSFSQTDGGDVSVGDDVMEVEWFEGWKDKGNTNIEPEIVASEAVDDKPCLCQQTGGLTTMEAKEKKALITRLIGAAKSPFEESDRLVLEGMKDEKLTSLMGVYEGEAESAPASVETQTQAQPVAQSTTPAPDQVIISKEEYADIKASAAAYRQQQEQYRNSLITSIKAAQSAFTEDDMKVMSTPQLEKLATTLKVDDTAVDYSVRGVMKPNSTVTDKKDHTPPKSWDLALAERNKNKAQSTVTN
jgi:hypothetical protein